MTVQTGSTGQTAAPGQAWYACPASEVAARLGVDPAAGLTAAQAAEQLAAGGPNALPEEKPKPGWRRFALPALWELGKLIARRSASPAAPSTATG